MREITGYFDLAATASAEFGNARGVRNVFERVLSAQADRLATRENVTREELMCLEASDVTCAIRPSDTDSE